MSERKPRNRGEQRAARARMATNDISYTHALRLVREERAANSEDNKEG